MSIGEYQLLDPWFLLAGPLAVLALWWSGRGRRAALPVASTWFLAGLPRTFRQRLAGLPTILTVLAAFALAVALARPVTRDVLPIRSEGRDILLVLDVSSSMANDDVGERSRVRRVEAARDRALDFALARETDRVGLLTFARFPDLRCPPTLDEESLTAFLRPVDIVTPNSAEDGTAIGAALARAVEVLAADPLATRSDGEDRSRVVVLLSDGEETENVIPPEDAARLAHDAGIKVYTIGFGLGARGPFGGLRELSFDTLKEIAKTTSGEFFRARTSSDLAAVYARIDELETVELEDPRYRTVDWFDRPLLLAGGLLLLGLVLEFLWIRRSPA